MLVGFHVSLVGRIYGEHEYQYQERRVEHGVLNEGRGHEGESDGK